MAVCVKAVDSKGTNYLAVDADNPDPMNCPGWTIPSGDEYRSFWISQPVEITPEQILYVFSWGLGSVLALWAIGYMIGVAVKTLRQV